jgi:hypothetical protein
MWKFYDVAVKNRKYCIWTLFVSRGHKYDQIVEYNYVKQFEMPYSTMQIVFFIPQL